MQITVLSDRWHGMLRRVSVVMLFAVASELKAQELPVPKPVNDPLSQGVLQPWVGDFAKPSVIAADAEEILITNGNGLKLRGWYVPAKKNSVDAGQDARTILICMGNTGNVSMMLPYAKIFHDGGFRVLMFDYQGFGASEGDATCLSLYSDVGAAFDWLVNERKCKAENIGVFGVSLGSVLAIAIAADRNAGAVAVEDVFVPEDMIARQFGPKPDAITQLAIAGAKTIVLPKVDPIRNVARLKCPLFLLHGANDRLLPPSGTMKVAAAAATPPRVWIMEGVGHAPESLEVNDLEYAGQLTEFFRQGFTKSLVDPSVTVTTKKMADTRFAVDVKVETTGDVSVPIQICVGSKNRVICGFRRCMVSGTHTESFELNFEPDHVSAIRALHVIPSRDGRWSENLSEYSICLADCNLCMNLLFASMSDAVQDAGGRWFYSFGVRYPKSVVRDVMARLPEPEQIPERIRPRYAKLLARIQCWPNAIHESDEPVYAEKMLKYLPPDPNQYYEMGNARIEIGFRDSVVGDALYRLARHRLRHGRVEEARELLNRHVQVLPPFVKTNLTPEQIASMTSLEELDRPDSPATNSPAANESKPAGQ